MQGMSAANVHSKRKQMDRDMCDWDIESYLEKWKRPCTNQCDLRQQGQPDPMTYVYAKNQLGADDYGDYWPSERQHLDRSESNLTDCGYDSDSTLSSSNSYDDSASLVHHIAQSLYDVCLQLEPGAAPSITSVNDIRCIVSDIINRGVVPGPSTHGTSAKYRSSNPEIPRRVPRNFFTLQPPMHVQAQAPSHVQECPDPIATRPSTLTSTDSSHTDSSYTDSPLWFAGEPSVGGGHETLPDFAVGYDPLMCDDLCAELFEGAEW